MRSPVPLCVAPLTSAEAKGLSQLFRKVLAHLPYYNAKAVRAELAKYTAERLQQSIASYPYSVLAAKYGDTLVGFCIGRPDDDLLWLEWFGVHPDHRRKGIASTLLQALETVARDGKAHKIWCDSRTDNEASKRILTRHCYNQLCTIRNHWYGQDFILWEKSLD